MEVIALLNGRLITPFHEEEGNGLVIEDGKITQMGSAGNLKMPCSCEKIDLAGKIVMPGFIDLHVHGFCGYDFEKINFENMNDLSRALFRHGTTGILPTLIPEPRADMIKLVRRYAEYISKEKRSSAILGIHCEGPFLNREMHGAINPKNIWDADMDAWQALYEASRGCMKLMTIAPELEGGLDIIRKAASDGVVISIGHSNASFEKVVEAIDNGACQITHIYNAMPLTHHRSPGILGAAYLYDELKVQLIADGVHVNPFTIKFLMKLKGAGGIILISDAIYAAGQKDGIYEFGGQKIEIKDGRTYTEDGTIAGSCLTLDQAFKNMVISCEVPITQAARMASLNAAKVLRLDHKKGVLAVGKDADIVVLDENLDVEMTIFNGSIVYRKNEE